MTFTTDTMNYEIRRISDSWGRLQGGRMDQAAYKYLCSNNKQMTVMENCVTACQLFGLRETINTNIKHGSKGKFWTIQVGSAAEIMIYV